MLPAVLLRRPGLRRLVRLARAYAEAAAAAAAPSAGPGQMSFTFASPTQVRTPVALATPPWSPVPGPHSDPRSVPFPHEVRTQAPQPWVADP